MEEDQFSALLGESQKFCAVVGLHKELILEIYQDKSDWAFILKIDSLLETAAKEIVCKGLKIKFSGVSSDKDALKEFIYSLPMNGKVSILDLLRIAQCPEEQIRFIECVRVLRNSFAHNIRNADSSLIGIVMNHREKSRLIKSLSRIEKYDEADLVKMYEVDGGMFRFGILNGAMTFLTLGYHVALK